MCTMYQPHPQLRPTERCSPHNFYAQRFFTPQPEWGCGWYMVHMVQCGGGVDELQCHGRRRRPMRTADNPCRSSPPGRPGDPCRSPTDRQNSARIQYGFGSDPRSKSSPPPARLGDLTPRNHGHANHRDRAQYGARLSSCRLIIVPGHWKIIEWVWGPMCPPRTCGLGRPSPMK